VSTVTTTVGKFVWHEQVSSDPKQAQSFYTELFGWDTEVFKPGEFDYAMIASGGQMHGGFSKAQEGAPPPHWLGHIHVESVDETVEKAKKAGGKIAFGPMDMPEVGRFAIIIDPQGAFVSAYQPEGEGPSGSGVFVWDELGTNDLEASKRFYGDVFGWKARDMGEEYRGYNIFSIGETDLGGLMTLPDSSMPPLWVPYVGVEDADGTVAKAKELGASVILDPMDVPNVGRLAVLRDPQGAIFAIIKPSPSM
jgi:predicted enzyme related to lactoylglutathione lyase